MSGRSILRTRQHASWFPSLRSNTVLDVLLRAGPTGYGLCRLIRSLGHECVVAAPSLIPKKPGVRVKTNRRDAVQLAKLSRADELTAVWVPDERHEAVRDLSRARQAAKKHLISKRQQISSLMLRRGCHYPGKTTWGPTHINWLMQQKLEHREQRIALEELLDGMRQEAERVEHLEQSIREAVPEWSLAGVATALQAMRGIDLVAAVTLLAEIRRGSVFFQMEKWIVRSVRDLAEVFITGQKDVAFAGRNALLEPNFCDFGLYRPPLWRLAPVTVPWRAFSNQQTRGRRADQV
jgi:transposase